MPLNLKTGLRLRGQAVPNRSLNQKPHLSGQFGFSTPKVRPDPVLGPLADLGLAPAGFVLADGLDLGLLRVPFLAHCRGVYGGGLVVGQPPE